MRSLAAPYGVVYRFTAVPSLLSGAGRAVQATKALAVETARVHGVEFIGPNGLQVVLESKVKNCCGKQPSGGDFGELDCWFHLVSSLPYLRKGVNNRAGEKNGRFHRSFCI